MVQITYPMQTGKKGVVSSSPKANGSVQYPSFAISTDVCGNPDAKSLGLHADFRAKETCTERIMNDFLTLHYGLRIPVDSNELPYEGSGLADIFFTSTELLAAGFANFGDEWRKTDVTGTFIEYRANTYNAAVLDQCDLQFGQKLENNIQRYGYDSNTCRVLDLGNMKVSSILADISNYTDWLDAFITNGVFDDLTFEARESAFLTTTVATADQFIADNISAIIALGGTDIVLGVA